MSFQYKIRGEQFVQFERQSQDYIEERDQDLESALNNLNVSSLTVDGNLNAGSVTVDGVNSDPIFIGDWSFISNYSAVEADKGYLLLGNDIGDTAIYLRSITLGPVNIGAYNSTTLSVGNGTATVTGTLIATTFSGSGASLTSIPAAQLTGTVANARISGAYSNFTNITASGNIIATAFAGDGAFLTSIGASALTGTIANARISGSYSNFSTITCSSVIATNQISFANALFQTNLPTSGAGIDAEFVTVGGDYYIRRNTSTRQDKENIQPLNAIVTPSMVDAINVQLWNRKTAPGIPEIGPIAEDMHDISPFLSAKGVDFDADGNMISKEPEGINKNAWLSLLTIAIQDLRQRLQQLETP